MKRASLLLLAATTCLLATPAFADLKDDVTQSMKALNDAPAYRMKVVSTDTNTKAVNTITVESTNPDGLHMKVDASGKTQMEIYSDGKKTLMSQAGGPLQDAPPQMSAMIGQMRKSATMEGMIGMAKDLKVEGKDSVNGVPATIYTFNTEMMGITGANKMWVSDKDHRPLKSEASAHGDMQGQKVDQAITISYDYDPSIKIVMPAAK